MNNRSIFDFSTGQCTRIAFRRAAQGAVLATLMGGASLAHAQLTTADILGAVTDASGAVLPNAQVQVKNLGTNETRSATTDSSGNYTVSNLQPGHYSITVTASGFKSLNVKDLAV